MTSQTSIQNGKRYTGLQRDYVCETGWPNMHMQLNFDGWLGIAPVNEKYFYVVSTLEVGEDFLIRENWVLVDLLDMYDQVGIDVFKGLGN